MCKLVKGEWLLGCVYVWVLFRFGQISCVQIVLGVCLGLNLNWVCVGSGAFQFAWFVFVRVVFKSVQVLLVQIV